MNALSQPENQQMLSQVVGGLMSGAQQGGGQQGGTPVNQLLGGLEQVIGGKPGSGQPISQGGAVDPNGPIMGLPGPVANAVAAKSRHLAPGGDHRGWNRHALPAFQPSRSWRQRPAQPQRGHAANGVGIGEPADFAEQRHRQRGRQSHGAEPAGRSQELGCDVHAPSGSCQ